MNRREVLKSAVFGAGILSTPAAGQKPAHAAATAKAPGAWAPKLFDAHQNETVVTLAELIIPETDTPGAKAARVNEYIDLILHDRPPERRNLFLEGLAGLDGKAIQQHRASFAKCPADRQTAMLESEAGSEFFSLLKELVVQGYYTSREGIAELNKDGVPDTFACPHERH